MLTDSNNISTTMKSDAGQVNDKRLRIVVSMLRKAFDPDKAAPNYENAHLFWIPTTYMVCALKKLMCTAMLVAFVYARKFVVPTAGQKQTVKAAEVLALSMASLTGCAATAAANGPDAQQPVVIRGIGFAHDYFENVCYWLKLGFCHYTGLGEERSIMSLDSIFVMLALYSHAGVADGHTFSSPYSTRSSTCTVRRSWTCTPPTRRSSM